MGSTPSSDDMHVLAWACRFFFILGVAQKGNLKRLWYPEGGLERLSGLLEVDGVFW